MRVDPLRDARRDIQPELHVGRSPREDEAWVGFGGNLGDRLSTIRAALSALGSSVEEVSPIYETAPWGITAQPWFLNGVARLRWTGSAADLLRRCLQVERELGRVRGERFGPRIIDLDLLLLGPGSIEEPGLTVPHPGIAGRRSVLEPWADLSPDLVVPGASASLSQLRAQARGLPGQDVRLFSED